MCSIHIPEDFTNIDAINEIITKHGLQSKIIVDSMNSIKVRGEITEDFVNELVPFEENGVFVIKDDLTLKSYSDRINPIRTTRLRKRVINPRFNKAYNINQLRSIYRVPTVTSPTRRNIAIIQLGGGYVQRQLNTFWNYLGMTTIKPNVRAISVDRAINNPGRNNDDFEVYLDIEVVGGMCPNSNINVYFAQNSTNSFYNAILRAMNDNNKIISISWGAPEDAFGRSTMNAYNSLFATAVSRGITICVASGDNGAKDNGYSLSVDFPASSPNVLACGGTTLVSNNNLYDTNTVERSWTGSGGGYSSIFAKPSYQTGSFTRRAVPDIASVADPSTGYIIYLRNTYYVIGGTSAVSPLWAGFLGYIGFNANGGQLNRQLYNNFNSNTFNDIVVGHNNGYTTTVGHDLCTGLGSPNFTNIRNVIN